jgi:hypothetical protein
MALQENLNIAQAANAAVRSLNYKSNNRGVDLDGLSAELSDTRGKMSTFMYKFTYDTMASQVVGEEPRGLDSFVVTAAVAKRLQFGNCEARSALALIFAAKRFAVRPLELFSVGDDHAFLVIGRTAGQIPALQSWNDDAVICDPWAEDYYAKGQLTVKATQAPLAAVVGAEVTLRQYFEHRTAGWPPAALKHFLDQSGLNDLWP